MTNDQNAEDRDAVIHAHHSLRAHRDSMRRQTPSDPVAAVIATVDRWSAAVIACQVVHQARLALADGDAVLIEVAEVLHRAETAWVMTLACEALVCACDDDGESALVGLQRALAVARDSDLAWLVDLSKARLLGLGLVLSQIGEADRASVQARRVVAAGRWHLLAATR